jgi:subtilase family serine protease
MTDRRDGRSGRGALRSAFLACIALAGCGSREESLQSTNAALVAGVDLTVTAFAPPATVASRELVPFSWTVTNNGMATATPTTVGCCAEGWGSTWADSIYLSSDATWSGDDVLVGNTWRPGGATLASGAGYTQTATLQMPSAAPGAYYLIGVTDGQGNRVAEASDANNAVAVAVTVTRADLGVTAAAAPASAGAQQLVTLDWTVDNHGTGAASGLYAPCCATGYFYRWEDAVYLSTDATLSADDIKFATLLRPDQYKLAAGAGYAASGAFQLPNVPPGSYQLLFATDSAGNRVDETSETDNVLARPITIGTADLTVSAFTAPAFAGTGELISVSYTVGNLGSGGATGRYVACCASGYFYRWEDAVYLSTDATLSADDIKFATVLRSDSYTLAAGASYSVTTPVQVPVVPPGNYYLLVQTDSAADRVAEQSESNNVRASAIVVGKPDLVVASATAPASAAAQQLVNVTWTVTNRGGAGASGRFLNCCATGYFYRWEDAVYLSTDATLSSDDVKIGSLFRPDGYTLAANASYTASAAVQLPAVAAGTYHLLFATDSTGDRVSEQDEANNVFDLPITVGRADLAVTAVSGPPTAAVLETIVLSFTVGNLGDGGATGRYLACCANGWYYRWDDAVYLSSDATWSSEDVRLGSATRSDGFTLASGGSYAVSQSYQAPEVPSGAYYLLYVTDATADRVFETSEANNVVAAPITIGRADLTVSALTGPANPVPGAPVALTWTVANSGAGTAAGRYQSSGGDAGRRWRDSIYLSRDAVLGPDDVLLGSRLQADGFTLAAGASYAATVATTLPASASGSYYLLAIADPGDRVPESDETDNVRAVAIAIAPLPDNSTTAAPGCDQFPNRIEADNCEQNCCAEDDICSVEHDCAGSGAGTQACTDCRDQALVCAGYCVGGLTDCARSACGCGRSLCYSTACAAGRTGYCAGNCDMALNDICATVQHPGKAMLGAKPPVTAIPDAGSIGYRFTPKRSGTATALGGLFAGSRTVHLYRYSTGAELAHATHTSSNAFGYTSIAPLALQAGVTYVVAVDLTGGEGASTAAAQPVPGDYLNLTIDCAGAAGAAGAMPSSCSSTYKGMADVKIEFGP